MSDSIGETAEKVCLATASQFLGDNFDIIRIPYVDSAKQIESVVLEAAKSQSLICHTIVSPVLRDIMDEQTKRLGVKVIDILGPMIHGAIEISGLAPKNQPGLMHVMSHDYFKRIEAVEFAVKYDDGKNPWGLSKADVVIIGVSRTSKTPLSMYLAHQRRIKVANVPLVPELMPPEELFKLPADRIVGLIVNPAKLNEVRLERLKTMGLSDTASYANDERIMEELVYAKKIMQQLNCLVIDVSNRAIEETANVILDHVRKAQ